MFEFLLISYLLKKEKKREVTSDEVLDAYFKAVGLGFLFLIAFWFIWIIISAVYEVYFK